MKWLAILVVALVAAPAADAAKRLRPDAVPAPAAEQLAPNAIQVFNDFVSPARAYPSRRAVVHYVVLGFSAPPLNDDDADGVPDYVERVGDAADAAIAYYERRGFARILADAGGPDARPDLYVSRFAAGYFGVAYPAADAEGGAFLAVSNTLDPSPTQSLGSLYGTVAHELFHLVQFSYFKPTVDPPLDGWVLEGTAAAMEGRVYPDLEDIVSSLQLRHWFAAPQRSVTEESYGAQLLWRYLDERDPRILPAYLARVAAGSAAARTLDSTYSGVTGRSFAATFGGFAQWIAARYGERITPFRTLWRRSTGTVAPLAIHYLRLSRATRTVSVRVPRGQAEVALTYTLASMEPGSPGAARRLDPQVTDGGRTLTFTVPARLRGSGRYERPLIVLANGAATGRLSYSASVA